MHKTFVVLFAFVVFCSANVKEIIESKSEERGSSTEHDKDYNNDENESASIQVIHKAVVKENIDTLLNDDNPHEKETKSAVLEVTNSTKGNSFFEDSITDSDDTILETNPVAQIEEVLIPSGTSIDENNDYTNRQEEIAIVIEHITKAKNLKDNNEDSSALHENENNWRSLENNNWRSGESFHSGIKEYTNVADNEEMSFDNADADYSAEDYMDKKIDLGFKDRMEARRPDRRQHNMRPTDVMHYGPPDDHRFLDSAPIRSIGEIVIPRYRPVLTRNGIVYTPTLYTVQTASPALPSHNWIPNRPHINPEREIFTRHRNTKTIGIAQYEADTKMIDDYSDYGSNTYSYTPMMKITTQAPPQQIISPNKFDVFQKLVDASNQPKLSKRTFSDPLPDNYYQRQYSENYRPYDVRRFRRNAWDELPFQEILE